MCVTHTYIELLKGPRKPCNATMKSMNHFRNVENYTYPHGKISASAAAAFFPFTFVYTCLCSDGAGTRMTGSGSRSSIFSSSLLMTVLAVSSSCWLLFFMRMSGRENVIYSIDIMRLWRKKYRGFCVYCYTVHEKWNENGNRKKKEGPLFLCWQARRQNIIKMGDIAMQTFPKPSMVRLRVCRKGYRFHVPFTAPACVL